MTVSLIDTVSSRLTAQPAIEVADEIELLCPGFFDHSAQISAGAIKVATVKRYHYDRHDPLHMHLAGFIAA